jgi:hypothetical protein
MEGIMKKAKVRIFDDSSGQALSWKEDITRAIFPEDPFLGNIDVDVLTRDEFSTSLKELENRRVSLREGKGYAPKPTLIDECAILIVDFDLIDFWRDREDSKDSSDVTGEWIAYLARCFSDCGYIIALNQGDPNPAFDLTLQGNPGSFADLNLPAKLVGSPWLWRGIGVGNGIEFFPWYWPVIPQAASAVKNCRNDIKNPDATIIDKVGLSESDLSTLHYDTIDFLIGDQLEPCDKPFALTARQIAKGAMQSIRPKDVLDPVRIPSICASRVRAWLHWFVLPAQNPISDFPHAVMRLPALLSLVGDIETINKLSTRDASKIPYELINKEIRIKDYALQKKQQKWWPVPVLQWNRLLDSSLAMNIQMKATPAFPFVFCEDVSLFLGKDKARVFRSKVLSAYQDRFVSNPDKVMLGMPKDMPPPVYLPANRLSM